MIITSAHNRVEDFSGSSNPAVSFFIFRWTTFAHVDKNGLHAKIDTSWKCALSRCTSNHCKCLSSLRFWVTISAQARYLASQSSNTEKIREKRGEGEIFLERQKCLL